MTTNSKLLLVGGVIGLLYLFRGRVAATVQAGGQQVAGGGLSPEDQHKLDTINSVASENWGQTGASGGLSPSDKYPGFYNTWDGGLVNPDTGESYQPGTSPPMETDRNAYATGAMQRPMYNPSPPTPIDAYSGQYFIG